MSKMDNRLYFEHRVAAVIPQQPIKKAENGQASTAMSFQRILADEISAKLKFSQHAQQRLKQRNIELGAEELTKLNAAAQKAREKGAKESLILYKDLALIVSIKNNTVITAVDGQSLRENVFTNIDSAVIV